jgi:hypothetical protein
MVVNTFLLPPSTFVLNMIGLHAAALIFTGFYSTKLVRGLAKAI